MEKKSFYTKVIHAGEDYSENFGAVSAPIYNASTFVFNDAETGRKVHNYEQKGYFYSRLGNPTQEALEKAVAELEEGESALAFSSGMAAITASILTCIKSGEHLVLPEAHYATTGSFADFLSENFGVSVSYVDSTKPENYAAAIRENTKILYLETPANPTLKISDIAAISAIAKEKNIVTIADNTFASPFNQNPLTLGVDVVVHSATKYLGGHSDLTAGVMVGNHDIIEKARLNITKLFGGNIAPQTAWLVLRGIKTLALRMERHNYNASVLADMLSQHSKVRKTYYPGLATHENHQVAKKQMKGFGGMIAFDVGSIENGVRFLNSLRLCKIATSLGGVETIVQHSASMTNANVSREIREKAGITDGLIRLSVGIEDVEDLKKDIEQALMNIGEENGR